MPDTVETPTQDAIAASTPPVPTTDLLDADAPSRGPSKADEARRANIRARWESVREERERWLVPFRELKLERALDFLNDLQRIWEEGSAIINERINADKMVKCAGPRCGKDLSGTLPNGRPKWVGVKTIRNPRHPDIMQNIYFCSEVCQNMWIKKTDGAGGSTK